MAVLGAAGGIGQPLSLLMKLNPRVTELGLYDIKGAPGGRYRTTLYHPMLIRLQASRLTSVTSTRRASSPATNPTPTA